jgi:hypothetical protein
VRLIRTCLPQANRIVQVFRPLLLGRKRGYKNEGNKCHDSVDAIGEIQNTFAESRLTIG